MPSLVKRTEPSRNGRTERLSVNLPDLDRVDPNLRLMLLGGKLALDAGPIRTDPDRMDETAVEFSCDLLTACCIADTLRSHDRAAGDHPTRVYLRKSSQWVKLQGSVVLTRVVGGKVILDPEMFPTRAKPGELAAPPVTSVTM